MWLPGKTRRPSGSRSGAAISAPAASATASRTAPTARASSVTSSIGSERVARCARRRDPALRLARHRHPGQLVPRPPGRHHGGRRRRSRADRGQRVPGEEPVRDRPVLRRRLGDPPQHAGRRRLRVQPALREIGWLQVRQRRVDRHRDPDNILAEIGWGGPTADEDYNLFSVSRGRGATTPRRSAYAGGQPGVLRRISAGRGSTGGHGERRLRPWRSNRRGRRTARFGRQGQTPTVRPPAVGQARRPPAQARLRLRIRMLSAGTVALNPKALPNRRPNARPVRMRKLTLKFVRAGSRTISLRLSGDARRRLLRWGKPKLVIRTFSDTRRRSPSGTFVLAVGRR